MSEPLNRRFDTMVDLLLQSVAEFADHDYIGEKRDGRYEFITFRQYGKLVEEARSGLKAIGVEKGDRVAVIADNCTEWAVLAMATYSLGAVYVPMYEAQKPEEREFIIDDCRAKVVCVRNAQVYTESLPLLDNVESVQTLVVFNPGGAKLDERAVSYVDLRSMGLKEAVPPAEVSRDDLCNLIYTSGTTGKPKGVMLSHANVADNISAFLQVTEDHVERGKEVSVAFLPWAHAYGQVAELYLALANGQRIALAESPQTLLNNIAEIRPTILLSVPRVWNRVYTALNKRAREAGGLKQWLFERAVDVAARREELRTQGKSSWWLDLQFKLLDRLVFDKVREVLGGRLKFAISGAAALSAEVAKFIHYLGITVSEGYGLTESSPGATYNPFDDPHFGTVGVPLPGVEIGIRRVDSAPEGQGEVVIYGHNVMQGYYNRPEENKTAFTEDGGLRTGDLGFLDDEGFVHITGRVKEQYKLENGKYVAPAPLEEAIKLSPLVSQIFLHGANKQYNVALVVPDAEAAREWADEHDKPKDLKSLIEDPDFRREVANHIQAHSKGFKGFERVRNFAMLSEEFTTENGMLTPTMKIKRHKVLQEYGDLLEGLYDRDKEGDGG